MAKIADLFGSPAATKTGKQFHMMLEDGDVNRAAPFEMKRWTFGNSKIKTSPPIGFIASYGNLSSQRKELDKHSCLKSVQNS
uniref:Uncharacterized protein n=1 Tax=Kalanchoe fedtschenkoi TaxID=63787 RepID=A0A7N0V7T1_KALFE